MARNQNQPVRSNATSALEQMKYEIANELGIPNYEQIDKGQLPSRVNGYVGGNITKKMVAFAEQAMANGQLDQVNQSAPLDTPNQQ